MDTSSLMEQILANDNFNRAYLQVVRNKGGMTVEEALPYLKEYQQEITDRIYRGKYTPFPVRRVEIPKPDGDVRKLGIPMVVDRTLQHLASVLGRTVYCVDSWCDWFQMEEIRKGLEMSLNVSKSKYADYGISFDKMCQIRKGLKRRHDEYAYDICRHHYERYQRKKHIG